MEAYSRKYNYIIVWSAKSGCTLFRQLFLDLHKEELERKPYNKWHYLSNDFTIPKNINKKNTKKIFFAEILIIDS